MAVPSAQLKGQEARYVDTDDRVSVIAVKRIHGQ